MTDREKLVAAIVRWRMDAAAFARECLGVEKLDKWQETALRILSEDKPLIFLAMIACKGPGKSFILAVAGLWWWFTRRYAQVICTSITADNLKLGTWKEIVGLFNSSPILRSVGEVRSDRILMLESPTNWFIAAMSWAKDANAYSQASTLAGLHGPCMMYLGDECGDYSLGVLPAAEAMGNNAGVDGNEARIIVAGNPTDESGPLGAIVRQPQKWRRIHITADPDDPERTTRVPAELARAEIELKGRDHPHTRVNLLGLFPLSALTTLLSPDDVLTSMKRKLTDLDWHWAQKRLSVDVARFGLDKTVICFRQGVKLGPYVELQGADTQEVAARVAIAKERTGAEVVIVDADGLGGGVVDALRVAGIQVHAVHSAGKPVSPKYYNRRAEMASELADWVKTRGVVPAGKSELEQELSTIRYSFLKGKILIEDKDDIRKRLGRSCDYFDATALSFALPDAAAVDPIQSLMLMHAKNRAMERGDWNPIEDGGAHRGDFDPWRNA